MKCPFCGRGEDKVVDSRDDLGEIDQVAYVRFASVYLDFQDVKEFMGELKQLLRERSRP